MAAAPPAETSVLKTLDSLSSSPNASPPGSNILHTGIMCQAGVKRKASAGDELESDLEVESSGGVMNEDEGAHATETGADSPALSKRQMKRLKRQQAWEEAKGDRRARRREKRHNRQARKRAEKEHDVATVAQDAGAGPSEAKPSKPSSVPLRSQSVPVTFMIDCDFEEYMHDNEIVSLSTQIARSYSENRKAPFRAHLVITSFGGKLKERFETSMGSHHTKWKGVRFVVDDFVHAANSARQEMSRIQRDAGNMEEVLGAEEETSNRDHLQTTRDTEGGRIALGAQPDTEQNVEHQDIVYLTSDSNETLSSLESNMIYVIGGIVDRNREKGLCYQRAKARKVRTAKLPIGEFMAMSSRHVLTTNQVVEIMSQFLIEGDWGKAFVKVIPQRKGGTLKVTGQTEGSSSGADAGGREDGEPGKGVAGENDEQGAEADQHVVSGQDGALGANQADATANPGTRE